MEIYWSVVFFFDFLRVLLNLGYCEVWIYLYDFVVLWMKGMFIFVSLLKRNWGMNI